MAYLKKIAVPSESGTVEVCIGSLELKILRKIKNGNNLAWKIAGSLSSSSYYQNVIYQTILNMKRKGLINTAYEGKKGGLTVALTPFGEKVIETLKEKTTIGYICLG